MNKFSWLIACFFTLSVSAQEKLVVMGKASNRYVVHTVNGKETLQTISNLYGQSVTKLAAYNALKSSAVLPKGTGVKIPLSNDLIVQRKNDNSAPLYHVIQKGDNLYRLSLAYNKVPLSLLKEWNHMKNDVVKNGQLLIVGFMVNAPVSATEVTTAESKKEGKVVAPVQTNTSVLKEVKQLPVQQTPVENVVTPTPAPVKKKEVQEQPAVVLPITENKTNKEVKPAVKKPEERADYIPKEGDEGYFAAAYTDHAKEQTQQFRSGDAAAFKTISGWTDRKYYVLMNDVAPRTVVRITGTTNKSICAMVLGPLQETKGAAGLLLRISNSAISALGITDAKFTVTVTYFE